MNPEKDCPECRDGDIIRDSLRDLGDIEAHVTTEPPIVKSIWTESFTCPECRRTWFAEPTPEQRAKWVRERAL